MRAPAERKLLRGVLTVIAPGRVTVALPVDLLLNHLFEIANEDELPETWVEAPPASTRMVLGRNCHNGWRLADPATPVSDIVLWLVHQRKERYFATAVRLVKWLWRNLRPRAPRLARLSFETELGLPASAAGSDAGDGAAHADAVAKRIASAAGLIGVYAVWVIMSWFIFVCAPRCPASRTWPF